MFYKAWKNEKGVIINYNSMSDTYVRSCKQFCRKQAIGFIKYYIDFTIMQIKRKRGNVL